MTSQPLPTRIGLIGAGYISTVHAEVLKALNRPISAIVDANPAAGDKLARQFGIASVFGSVEEALAADGFERAHVLVPPDRHHAVAIACLKAGKPVFVEKPLSVSDEECASIIEASSSSAPAGVNQNFVFHPAFIRLTRDMRERTFGKPRYVSVVYHAPLRQLAARQFGHWMFRDPRNLLLEQAVHPLSQLLAIGGAFGETKSVSEVALEIAPGVNFIPGFTATLTCGLVPASLRFSVGQSFPFWQVQVACDDGVLIADILANRYCTMSRTRWLEPIDLFASGYRSALSIAAESSKNVLGYGLSTIQLKPRSDAFFQSMRNSIGAFHTALDEGSPVPLDATFGRNLVEICERISAQAGQQPAHPAPPLRKAPLQEPDVAVLGGTGFIGMKVVERLRDAGLRVSVLARNTLNLPKLFSQEGVAVRSGDIRSLDDVSAAVNGAQTIVNLAHGGGGASWEAIRDAMVGGVETIAKVSLKTRVDRLVHVGSIASLYLGPQSTKVTGATPPDPYFVLRADYARAKAMCDLRLQALHREENLPVSILRPGLVIGEGTSPFHSGVGFFNNEQHCIGWNEGRNPLPFVLVEDVAQAIYLSLAAPNLNGHSYNLVGDVRLTAREYIRELAGALERPLRYHPKSPYSLYCEDLGKWVIKRASGRGARLPSIRDLLSRGLKAQFDCTDVASELGWRPIQERNKFLERGIWVHAR